MARNFGENTIVMIDRYGQVFFLNNDLTDLLQCDYSKRASLKRIYQSKTVLVSQEVRTLLVSTVCMLQCNLSVYGKGRHPLFSINVLIGYFSSNWPLRVVAL